MARNTLLQLLILLSLLPVAAVSAEFRDALSGPDLVQALRRGGFNIYFRHVATDWSQSDRVNRKGDWTSCDPEKMRQLSPQGRATAEEIGGAIRRLDIPVSRVFSSQYCRTRQTAKLLGLGPVSPTPDIMNLRAADFVGGRDAVVKRARRILSLPPKAGTNTVFVAHGNLMRAVLSAYTGEAGAVVFAPQGSESFRIVAVLDPDDWQRLARNFSNRWE